MPWQGPGIFYAPIVPQAPGPFVPIPAQGQQPPFGAYPLPVTMNVIYASWPPVWWPAQQTPRTVVFTLTYGNQPPVGAYPIPITTNVIIASWPPIWWPAPPLLPTSAWNIPAANNPIPISWASYYEVIRLWDPPPPQPQAPPGYIVAQTLVYGQQPPKLPAPNLPTILTAWVPPWQQPQVAVPVAGIIPPPVVNNPPPSRPYPYMVINAWGATSPVVQFQVAPMPGGGGGGGSGVGTGGLMLMGYGS